MLLKQDGVWRNIYASPLATAPGVVFHGSNGTISRPSGFAYIIWRGDVEPSNAVADDIWITDSIIYNFDGTNWQQHEHTSVNSLSVSANYTFAIGDAGIVVEATAGLVFTIPTDASVAFDMGTIIEVFSDTTGTVSVTPDTGVTLVSPDNVTGSRDLSGRYAGATLRKRGTDTWAIHGSLL